MIETSPRPSWQVILGVAIWLIAVVAGYCWMTSYSYEAGKLTPAAQAAIAPSSEGKPVLFVFLHPECPCSNATVDELRRISEECGGKLGITAIFASYPTLPGPVTQSDLWQMAARIPGVTVLKDEDGSMRQRFHAATSGECLLLDHAGSILFHGGITSSRGHFGSSAGGDAIIAFYHGKTSPLQTAPVFGCTLDNH